MIITPAYIQLENATNKITVVTTKTRTEPFDIGAYVS